MPLDANVVPLFGDGESDDPFSPYDTVNSPIMFPVAERKVGWQMKDGTYMPTDSHKALVRVDPRNTSMAYVISIVNKTYKLIHNRELFSVIQGAMREHIPADNLKGVQVSDRISDYGKECFREYVFPNLRCRIGGSARSDVGFRIVAANGYGGGAIKLYAGAIEFFCTNGMIRGMHHATYRRHTSGCQVFNLDRLILNAVKTFTDAQDEWRRWANTPVSNARTMEFFKAIARSPALLDKFNEHFVREKELRGATMWTVYSTLTYFSSHNEGDFATRRGETEDGRVAAIMHQRELDVAKWTESDRFKALAEA